MSEAQARTGRPRSSVPLGIARALRRRTTPQEAKLWRKLRELRPAGYHFRRQVPIGNYVVDLACLKHRIVVELDGGHHGQSLQAGRDRSRDAHLASLGFRVLRFWNSEVHDTLAGVMDTIHAPVSGAGVKDEMR